MKTPKATKKARARKTAAAKPSKKAKAAENVFLHVAVSSRSREGLKKLVTVLGATSQRQVIEQLIADELHRRNMRLPRG